jgi:tripartite-type tricarboxylate transporter receptor subunit TctC
MPHIKAGKLKPLAVSTSKRIPALPDVPTLSEAGVPGYVADVWYGLQAPAGTPKAIVDKLNAEMTRIAKTPQMQERIEKLGAIPMYATPEQFAATIAAEGALWSELFKNVQIKTD